MFPKHRKYMHAYTCIHRTIPHKASPSTFVPPLTPRSSGQALGRDCKSASSKRVKRIRYTDLLDENILKLPRTHSCFGLIERDDKLDYDLPRKGAVAGHILRHCYSVLDLYLKKWQPMTFKVGYTHCAYFRFYNQKFGYIGCIDKFEHMVIVYAADETISPAFVEAAMIEKFKGNLAHLYAMLLVCVCEVCDMFIYIYIYIICSSLHCVPALYLRHTRLQK